MIVKQLDTLNLIALYQRQEYAMRYVSTLKQGMKLTTPLSFIVPFTQEDFTNIYETGGLYVIFIEITDNMNIVNPTLSQGILNLNDGENSFKIENIYTKKQNIPLKNVNEMANQMLNQLLEFKEDANEKAQLVALHLSEKPLLLKKSICEIFEA